MFRCRLALSLIASALCLALLGGGSAHARQDAPPATSSAESAPTDEFVRQLREAVARVEARDDLDEATKATAIESYNRAIASRRRTMELNNQATDSRRRAEEAPSELEALRQRLAGPASEVAPEVPEGASIEQIEQLRAQAEAELAQARERANELQSEATRRQERRTQIPTELASASQRLETLRDELASQTRTEGANAASEAKRLALEQRIRETEAEIEALNAEQASYTARQDLLPARRDLALRRVKQAQERVTFWQARLSQLRQREADRAAAEAKRAAREAARQHPVLRPFAEEVAQWAQIRASDQGLPSKISRTSSDLAQARTSLNQLREDYRKLSRRVGASGLSQATGLQLRRQYEEMQASIFSDIRQRLEQTERELADAEFTLIERQEEQIGAGDIDRWVNQRIAEIRESSRIENPQELEAVARELAVSRRDLLNTRVNDASTYFEDLAELAQVQRELHQAKVAFERYIQERILWVRSIAPGRFSMASGLEATREWIGQPEAWRLSLTRVGESLARQPFLGVLALLMAFVFVGLRRYCMIRLDQIARQVGSFRTDAYARTVEAFLFSAVAALQTPVLLWLSGWALTLPSGGEHALHAIGLGLQQAAFFLYPFAFIRVLCRGDGLAVAHFRWPSDAVSSMRANLRWFIPVVVPVVVIASAVRGLGDDEVTGSLGRLAFSAGLIALTVLHLRLFRPDGPIMVNIRTAHHGTWLERLRHVWYPLLILTPLALTGLSWLGYHYTATQLERRLEFTLLLVLVLVLVNGMLMRWLFLARRRVAVENAKRRREQAIAEEKARAGQGETLEEVSPSGPVAVDEESLDLPAISAQTRHLFRAAVAISVLIGLFAIWADVMPALRMLERVQVWPSVRVIETAETPDIPILEGTTLSTGIPPALQMTTPPTQTTVGGGSLLGPLGPTQQLIAGDGTTTTVAATATKEPLAITLADIGFAIIALIATYVLFRNLPGLAEIVVLQRLPLDAGSRYALGTVLRYLIAGVGIVIALDAMGLSWSNVQWLAAALTFGLAFGLQEIFANFVSGLIILAERPIRLNDTVTVGTTTGTVTRIRMRATTIRDWDRKEMIIPNKTFITSDIVNWTLGDTVLRLTIPVGVSYSSDVDLVVRTLESVASRNRNIMEDPAPQIVFRQFGDSTLNFEFRVFIPTIDLLPGIYHRLHMSILRAFRKAGIEIAFPQRDLHLRTSNIVLNHVEKREDLPPGDVPPQSPPGTPGEAPPGTS